MLDETNGWGVTCSVRQLIVCKLSSAKHQESNEENNKLKDQLKSNQDNLKYVINDKNIYLIFKSTTVVSSNTADGEMNSILHYVYFISKGKVGQHFNCR
jgi:hypothetical protein